MRLFPEGGEKTLLHGRGLGGEEEGHGLALPEDARVLRRGVLLGEVVLRLRADLFAVGDGNHSLASAKAHYEEEKAKGLPSAELSRYALVEVVNLYDDALEFEPIHRVLFDVDPQDVIEELKACYPGTYEGEGEGHCIRFAWEQKEGFLTIPEPKAQLEVGTLQTFLDDYLKRKGGRIDYVHGDEITIELGKNPGCLAFLLPAMDKNDLFKSIAADGPLPRKTFSMGHAEDKRYYIEARKIK